MQVTEGSGRLLVLAVGERSEWGRTMAMVASESAETPLQEALGLLAAAIGKVGLLVGGVCFVVLLIRWRPAFCGLASEGTDRDGAATEMELQNEMHGSLNVVFVGCKVSGFHVHHWIAPMAQS